MEHMRISIVMAVAGWFRKFRMENPIFFLDDSISRLFFCKVSRRLVMLFLVGFPGIQRYITLKGSMVLYMVCHGSHQSPPGMLALIYQHHGSVMGNWNVDCVTIRSPIIPKKHLQFALHPTIWRSGEIFQLIINYTIRVISESMFAKDLEPLLSK
jgi:hypothetical protein